MKRSFASLIANLCASLLVSLCYPDIARPAVSCDPWVAKAVSVQGGVEVRRSGATQWQRVNLNDTFCAGDQVRVLERSRADLTFLNQPVLRLDQNTTITLGGVTPQSSSLVELIKGAVHFFSRRPRNLEVHTAFVNAGVEGTEGLIEVQADRALITIFEGKVLASNQGGSLILTNGQSAVAAKGQAPVLRVVVRPRDAVQWALYYPPTLYFRPDDFPAGPGWEGMVRNSIEAYMRGDLQAAFESIKGVPDTVGEARFFIYRASLLLAVGRVDEASMDIKRALSLKPKDSEALALQAVVAVVQNDKDKALNLARTAVEADPKSASALIALSYAQQANFDLEGARNNLKQAIQASPENALAWARLADLHMSFAELDEALEAARKAAALSPSLSRTQTVLGFAYLTQVDTTQAKAAFEKAIEFDQADYLPRLGLGLAKIREGDLEDGRREIEIAASLDPNNSIVRSYLGKAYYEEKRGPLDEREYKIAKELDPKDPTPWFYDAIAKQTTNRPVEALQDMQKAIELNDNRMVYRSSLLLDSDLAARSAALGQIYNNLGFQQLGLVEGWKSVNTDPTNFSAHRLLADTYATLPRHEIARVSELLQSQLLQPLNMTPIQPRLAESNLFLISAGGPASLSFNEFNPLFNRNGVTFQTTGVAGENSTYGGEGVFSGIYNKISYSLGGFHFQTDGWRSNANQRDSIGNAFFQLELSPQTSVQAEVRGREIEQGDLQQRFFREVFSAGLTDRREIFSVRFGGRHSFSPDSIILGSFTFQNRRDVQEIASPPFLTKGDLPQNAFGFELQHLLRSHRFNLISGIGYFDVNAKSRIAIKLPFPPPLFDETIGLDTAHFNAYVYANVDLLRSVTVTLGGSYDYLNGKSAAVPNGNVSQFNPKFGIIWNPLSGTSVRAAVFRVIKRTLITDQTLEPTQVAGFNQFFDDLDVTKSWRYGLAVDQKFTEDLFGGVESSARNLKIPIIDATASPPNIQHFDGQEYFSRIYLFWTPHPWLALRAEYMFEGIRNDSNLGEPIRINTYRVPFGFTFAHPLGFGASLTTTYYNQGGKFPRPPGGFESGRDNFWTVDAAINYRLPQRYGFITVGATNLLDKKFRYFEVDRDNPRVQPGRVAFFRLTLALP
jgi:tetratricopeptide (TPR) repeat protein